MGRWTPLEEIDERLALKVGKIITSVGSKAELAALKSKIDRLNTAFTEGGLELG